MQEEDRSSALKRTNRGAVCQSSQNHRAKYRFLLHIYNNLLFEIKLTLHRHQAKYTGLCDSIVVSNS